MSGGNKVFVGNIPYGVTDEVIIDILGRCGTVVNFRAMTDKETGSPKGYGFAEFTDSDSAYSAVRNLNDFELQGRKLRVDYANEKDRKEAMQHAANQAATITQAIPDAASANRLPNLPPGVDLPPGVKAEDAISKTLNTLPVSQLLDFLVQMQTLVNNDPLQAQQLLDRSPQLSYAIFQSLLNMNLVDSNSLTQIISQAKLAPQPPQPPQVYAVPAPAPQPSYTPQQSLDPYQQPYQNRATPIAQPSAPPAPAPSDAARQQLINQVLAMTPEQISVLQPHEREQIMALRAQFGGQQYR